MAPSSQRSCWNLLRDYPPILVRLSARRGVAGRKNVAALSHAEIAIAANIPLSRIIEISRQLDWEAVTVIEAERFCAACGFDPTNAAHRNRQQTYLRSCQKNHPDRPPHYLRVSPHWTTQFQPLIQILASRSPLIESAAPSPSRQPAFAA